MYNFPDFLHVIIKDQVKWKLFFHRLLYGRKHVFYIIRVIESAAVFYLQGNVFHP